MDSYYKILEEVEGVDSIEYLDEVLKCYQPYDKKMIDFLDWVQNEIINHQLDIKETEDKLETVNNEKLICDKNHNTLRIQFGFDEMPIES